MRFVNNEKIEKILLSVEQAIRATPYALAFALIRIADIVEAAQHFLLNYINGMLPVPPKEGLRLSNV